eukprot:1809534-Alexandrium_andersonii.AAC.1
MARSIPRAWSRPPARGAKRTASSRSFPPAAGPRCRSRSGGRATCGSASPTPWPWSARPRPRMSADSSGEA